MSLRRLFLALFLLVGSVAMANAANEAVSRRLRDPGDLDVPSFEMASETSFLWGSLANPNSYEIGAQFITARWRWGRIVNDGWMRGVNQVYALAMAEPIFRGPENFYYGISVGLRYNFIQPGSRFQPYVSGGVGLGWFDSHADVFGAQGQ